MNDDEARDEFEAITSGQQMSRHARLLSGELTVEDLDDEELYRGQCRDRNGHFSGGRPDMIPRAMLVEWSRRIRQGGTNRLERNLTTAIDAVVQIIQAPETNTTDRLAASKYLIDRVLGKATDRVEVAVSQKPWEALMSVEGGVFRRIETEPRILAPIEIEPGE